MDYELITPGIYIDKKQGNSTHLLRDCIFITSVEGDSCLLATSDCTNSWNQLYPVIEKIGKGILEYFQEEYVRANPEQVKAIRAHLEQQIGVLEVKLTLLDNLSQT